MEGGEGPAGSQQASTGSSTRLTQLRDYFDQNFCQTMLQGAATQRPDPARPELTCCRRAKEWRTTAPSADPFSPQAARRSSPGRGLFELLLPWPAAHHHLVPEPRQEPSGIEPFTLKAAATPQPVLSTALLLPLREQAPPPSPPLHRDSKPAVP